MFQNSITLILLPHWSVRPFLCYTMLLLSPNPTTQHYGNMWKKEEKRVEVKMCTQRARGGQCSSRDLPRAWRESATPCSESNPNYILIVLIHCIVNSSGFSACHCSSDNALYYIKLLSVSPITMSFLQTFTGLSNHVSSTLSLSPAPLHLLLFNIVAFQAPLPLRCPPVWSATLMIN